MSLSANDQIVIGQLNELLEGLKSGEITLLDYSITTSRSGRITADQSDFLRPDPTSRIEITGTFLRTDPNRLEGADNEQS